VSIFKKTFCSVNRYLLFTVALFAGFAYSSAQAQVVAPQLLPYSVKVIAGGGTAGAAGWTAGKTCPVSGFTSTDIFGDGCLATEIAVTGPRTAVTDAIGNVFFTDYTLGAYGSNYSNGLIRRMDAITGVVTAVAGGVFASASPQSGAYCSGTSGPKASDNKGDGCLGNQVYLADPIGLVISPAGDLYFSEIGATAPGVTYEKLFGADVRKIAATGGVIPATGGVISTVDGALSTYITGVIPRTTIPLLRPVRHEPDQLHPGRNSKLPLRSIRPGLR